MKIVFTKINKADHKLVILKNNEVMDELTLNTKTYFLHDIVHFCVEKELHLKDGVWGMINKGYKMEELSGKTNELTIELRSLEKIVGPVQAVYSGYMTMEMFEENMKLVEFKSKDPNFLKNVLSEIKNIMNKWDYLPIGQNLELEWKN